MRRAMLRILYEVTPVMTFLKLAKRDLRDPAIHRASRLGH